MMCTTVLHGGVGLCHQTSIPHKSGNKMKEKQKPAVWYKIRPKSTRGICLRMDAPSNDLCDRSLDGDTILRHTPPLVRRLLVQCGF